MNVLTDQQKEFLEIFSSNKTLSRLFYLSGGTALTAFYIPYRYSDDLDFFSKEEVDLLSINTFIQQIAGKMRAEKVESVTSFNRNLFFLQFSEKYTLKLEFTYYPFEQVEQPRTFNNIQVDTPLDIAVNKLFTIYQKPATRHYMDLYMLCKKYDFEMDGLREKARVKFDTVIDRFQLGSQFLQAKNVIDMPKLVEKLPREMWQNFFTEEVKKIKKRITK